VERINKLLARAGVASRRAADQMIREGRVTLNGEIVRELGIRIDPARDAIKVDGRRIQFDAESRIYLMLHKPAHVVTTLSDPEGRPTVADYLKGIRGHVFPVGRLDFLSEGLLLLTNDGDWAQALMHPSSHVEKTYRVKVRGVPSQETLEKLSQGLRLDGRMTAPAQYRMSRRAANSWLDVTLTEGRKNQIRRLLMAVGHPVARLQRVAIDKVFLGDLQAGRMRHLRSEETNLLRAASARAKDASANRRKAP
jgi:23S rRNA pseudouridine2605 synthase